MNENDNSFDIPIGKNTVVLSNGETSDSKLMVLNWDFQNGVPKSVFPKTVLPNRHACFLSEAVFRK